MKTVNRSIIIISPKKQYIEWLRSLKISSNEINNDLYQNDCGSYLVEEINNINDFKNLIQNNYRLFFERELSGIELDKNKWPNEISIGTFNEWFVVNYHTVVLDLADTTLKLDDH